jgi:hypothetical protein
MFADEVDHDLAVRPDRLAAPVETSRLALQNLLSWNEY